MRYIRQWTGIFTVQQLRVICATENRNNNYIKFEWRLRAICFFRILIGKLHLHFLCVGQY